MITSRYTEEKLERITYEQLLESLQKEKRNDTGIL